MNRLAICLMVGGSLVGCKKSVKTAEVESWMKSRTTELGINATKVTCPTNIEPKEGKTFDCDIEVEGKTYTIVGTMTKVESSKVNFDTAWKNGANGVIIRSKLQPALAEELTKQFGTKVDIACAEPLLFLDAAKSTACDFTAGSTKAKISITFDDKLVPTGWKLDPPLLGKATLEEKVAGALKDKAPNGKVTCGSEALFPRPADGFVMCDIAEGDKSNKVKVTVDENLNATNWEIVQ